MKISLDWVRDYVDLPDHVTPAELAHELTLKTVEVEDVVDIGAVLVNIVVARVETSKALGEDAQHLRCSVGSRRKVSAVTRATGIAPGAMIALALPGATLARSAGEQTPITVKAAKILGVASEGVVCGASDLGLERLFPAGHASAALDTSVLGAEPGTLLAEALGFNDIVFEIDNKSLTNRPDLWGHYGIAREFAAIYDLPLKPLAAAPQPAVTTNLIGSVDATICQRISAVSFEIADNATAPLWIRSRLARIGEASINLCVDLSNYVMFTVGQPTHVYDGDRIELPLVVRASGATAKLDVLSGTVITETETPVIADAAGPVAIAGIIGSANSAVHVGSRRFVLEAATFSAQAVRRSSQRLGLRTEASARYEKGLNTQRVDQAVDLFLLTLEHVAPGSSIVYARQDIDVCPTDSAQVTVDLDVLMNRIGMTFDVSQVRRILSALGFDMTEADGRLYVTAPTWRSTGDISLPQDIVEEIARIYGYDNLPVVPLSVPLRPVASLHRRSVTRSVREVLGWRGAMHEVVTYPWVSDGMLAAAGLRKDRTVRFEGAPAPDRNSLRPSLVPNLLDAAVINLPYTDTFDIFEVGTAFTPGGSVPSPVETRLLTGLLIGSDGVMLFRRAKGILDMLREYGQLTDLGFAPGCDAPWADQSARLAITASGCTIGVLGLLTPRTKRMAGLAPSQVACFELDLDAISQHTSRHNEFAQLPEFPEADFDLSLVVADDVAWADVAGVLDGYPQVQHLTFVDEFRGNWVPPGHRSLTLRVTLRSQTGTLTAEAIGATRAAILELMAVRVNARLREEGEAAAARTHGQRRN